MLNHPINSILTHALFVPDNLKELILIQLLKRMISKQMLKLFLTGEFFRFHFTVPMVFQCVFCTTFEHFGDCRPFFTICLYA